MSKSHLSLIEQRQAQGLFRALDIIPEDRIDFQSNDYLGISRYLSSITPLNTFGGGATGSRLISGNTNVHESFESELAEAFHAPAALLFNSGYTANIGLISCIATKDDLILYDKSVHASLRDGIRLSLAKNIGFRHNDLEDLRQKLKHSNPSGQIYLVIETLYSMTGDTINISGILEIINEFDILLIADEAHAMGVMGKNGGGVLEQVKIDPERLIRIMTFGKSYGYFGAAILCTELMKSYLINFSRPFIYTTALPPSQVDVLRMILQQKNILEAERLILDENIAHFIHTTKYLRIQNYITSNKSPIQFLRFGDSENALKLASICQQQKIAIKAIRYPTVPKGSDGLRISLHSFNSMSEIDYLTSLLSQILLF